MEIGEPTLLARLPRGGLIENGQVQLAQVYGIGENGKKKRHEVCAAVDGNSVNVFEILNGRNISSFPVPPDASFVCQPCSSRSKLAGGKVQRKTFCVTKRRGRISIQCFIELQDGDSNSVQNSSKALEDSDDRIVLLQPSSDDQDVMILRESGDTSIFSSNASTLSLQTQLVSTSGPVQIIAGAWLAPKEARQSVLKSRTDISTSLSHNNSVLCAVYKHGVSQDLRLGIWILSPTSPPLSGTGLPPVIDHPLHGLASGIAKGRMKVEFFLNATRLGLETANMMLTFDLTTIIPRIISEQPYPAAGQTSYLDLSNNLSLTASKSGLQLFNTRYRSILATAPADAFSRKRKRNGPNIFSPVYLVAYFPQLRRVVAHQEHQLLAVDIGDPTNSTQNFKQSSLLIGNIGRGSGVSTPLKQGMPPTIGIVQEREHPSVEWTSTMERLNELVRGRETENFQQLFIDDITEELNSMPQRASDVPDFKLDFLLSKIFDVKEKGFQKSYNSLRWLKVTLLCPQLIRWSAQQGLLENHRLEKALSSPTASGSVVKLQPGAAAIALMEIDPTLKLVQYHLRQAPYLNPGELGVIVQSLVRNALLHTADAGPMAISDQAFEDSGKGGSDAPAALQAYLPQKQQNPPEHIIQCLVAALGRLAGLGPAKVSASIQASMDQSDILTLIQFLRQQLFRGGHTRYLQFTTIPSPPPSREGPHEVDPNDDVHHMETLPLDNIVSVLSSCVDAVGTLGIIGSKDDTFMKTLVSDLLSEISSASDALEEATYLEGLLRESLRYTESVEQQPDHVKSRLGAKPTADGSGSGNIVTLYSEGISEASSTNMQSALPVSLQVDDGINKVKVRKGGGQSRQRSLREMGMLQDRLRPAYSLERLVL